MPRRGGMSRPAGFPGDVRHGSFTPGGAMGYRTASIALVPLLALQGRRVRRVTPRLPEPPGPRAGLAGDGPPLRLLILGDSSAAGVGAPSQDEALSGRLVSEL